MNVKPKPKYSKDNMLIDTTSSHHSTKPNVVGSALSDFLNENLQKSKDEKWTNEMFGSGWIAALMHVKVNFLDRL